MMWMFFVPFPCRIKEHNIVLVRVGRSQDLPGVKLKCIRGVYDLGHVIKKK